MAELTTPSHIYGPTPEVVQAQTLLDIQDSILGLWGGEFEGRVRMLPCWGAVGTGVNDLDSSLAYWQLNTSGSGVLIQDLPVAEGDTIDTVGALVYRASSGLVGLKVIQVDSGGAATTQASFSAGVQGSWAWLSLAVGYTLVAGDSAYLEVTPAGLDRYAGAYVIYSRT